MLRLALAILLLPAALLVAERGRVQRTHLKVPVWLTAGPGDAAPALAVKLDGGEAEVTRVRGPNDELLLILVLDLAGDVALIDPARTALASAILQLPANAYVGLMRAQDGLRVILDPTADRTPVIDAIQAMPIMGKAGLLETVEPVSLLGDSILAKSSVRVAVLYVTDSDVYNYREDYTNPVINSSDSRDLSRKFPEALVREKISRLENRISLLQTPLFIVHLDYRRDRLNEAYQAGLMQLAEASGGWGVFCRSLPEIPGAIDRAFERILSHSSVEIALPDKPLKSVLVQLESGAGPVTHRTRFLLREK